MTRDTANAVALGMVIGGMLADCPDCEKGPIKPEAWRDIGWDQIVDDVDRATDALDRYQEWALMANPHFWDEHDWYLTLDKIADELWRDPREQWNDRRIEKCLVTI